MSIQKVIVSFGGITRLSRALDHRNPSTVQGWYERGIIPAHRQGEVLIAAQKLGVHITAEDLIPVITAGSKQ